MWDFFSSITVCFLNTWIFLKKYLYSAPYKIRYHLYFFIFYFSALIYLLVIWPVFFLYPKNVKIVKFFIGTFKHITKLYDVKWELRGAEILAEDRGAVIVSNHQSTFDVLGLIYIWEVVDKLTMVVKKELLYLMPFGLVAYLAGFIFIDRKNPERAYYQLQATTNVMVKGKTKVWLFPEGTRNRDYTRLLPFKKGAFKMAIAAQVPIIPVVFSPYYFISKEREFLKNGRIVIQCLEPIATKGLSLDHVEELRKQVQDKIAIVYKDLSREVMANLTPSDYQHTVVGEN
ncbi:unnamed protein product [Parnassius mnemosyne]|uniref:1-acyl-sn-glycerol-3-phosphate acyltransferase n=1 Tax=Parnassius mnemosyne TaxID=213953 RepID=A0AAV1M1H1_9NEOP